MTRKAALLLLGGCAQPISNASFYEDAAFVRAVPSTQDLGPPEGFLAAPDEASPLLLTAVEAAGEYADVVAPIGAIGDALRATSPSARTAEARTWEALTLAWSGQDGVHIAWVDVVIVDVDALLEVVIDAAAAREGPYTQLADGWRFDDGQSHLDVDASALVEAFGLPPAQDLAFDVTPGDAFDDVHVARTDGALEVQAWVVQGPSFGFSAELALTDDGQVWPGTTFARNEVDGGRATGQVRRADGVLGFEACWGPDGTTAYIGGDPGIAVEGEAGACTVAP